MGISFKYCKLNFQKISTLECVVIAHTLTLHWGNLSFNTSGKKWWGRLQGAMDCLTCKCQWHESLLCLVLLKIEWIPRHNGLRLTCLTFTVSTLNSTVMTLQYTAASGSGVRIVCKNQWSQHAATLKKTSQVVIHLSVEVLFNHFQKHWY